MRVANNGIASLFQTGSARCSGLTLSLKISQKNTLSSVRLVSQEGKFTFARIIRWSWRNIIKKNAQKWSPSISIEVNTNYILLCLTKETVASHDNGRTSCRRTGIYVVKINQVPRATKTEAESILSKVLDFPSFSEDGLKHWHLLWI